VKEQLAEARLANETPRADEGENAFGLGDC
jgi:hypothetical protein